MKNKKAEFRKRAIYELSNVQNKYYLSKIIEKRLESVIHKMKKMKKIENILFYMPFKFEANILALLKKSKAKHNCFIPLIEDIRFKMIPFRYPLKKNSLGIQEGYNSLFYKKNLDLMIIPILGYDKKNRRIGFGKGMYDKFFMGLKKKPLIIFIQLKNVFSKQIITEDFDVSFDAYISSKIIKKD